MDIEAIVARITQEVLQELQRDQPAPARPASAAEPDRLPPPGRGSPLPVRQDGRSAGHRGGKVCQALAAGECTGVGCCAQLIPNQVKAILESGADRVGNTLGGLPLPEGDGRGWSDGLPLSGGQRGRAASEDGRRDLRRAVAPGGAGHPSDRTRGFNLPARGNF